MDKKKGERKSEPDCARWTAAGRILTLVVVVDGSEQVGLPSPIEEAIFRAGSRGTCTDRPGYPSGRLHRNGGLVGLGKKVCTQDNVLDSNTSIYHINSRVAESMVAQK